MQKACSLLASVFGEHNLHALPKGDRDRARAGLLVLATAIALHACFPSQQRPRPAHAGDVALCRRDRLAKTCVFLFRFASRLYECSAVLHYNPTFLSGGGGVGEGGDGLNRFLSISRDLLRCSPDDTCTAHPHTHYLAHPRSLTTDHTRSRSITDESKRATRGEAGGVTRFALTRS